MTEICLNCGCNLAHIDHANSSNITYEDLAQAARAQGMSVNDALKVINQTVINDRVKHADEYDTKMALPTDMLSPGSETPANKG